MPDRDGFGVLEDLGDDVPRGIVFVTAHDEHALRAFDVHALDYVLKPFGRRRFDAAVERAIRRLDADDALLLRRTLEAVLEGRTPSLADLVGEAAQPARFAVRDGTRTVMVPLEEVEWIEAERDFVRLHTPRRAYLVSGPLHALETRLGPCRFHRIHRSTLVSLDHVAELRRVEDGGGLVVLDSGVQLRVSRARRVGFEAGIGMGEARGPGTG
jgi:two-component system LytT family response regulator